MKNPETPLSRGVPAEGGQRTAVRCRSCGKPLGYVQPGEELRDLPAHQCTAKLPPGVYPGSSVPEEL